MSFNPLMAKAALVGVLLLNVGAYYLLWPKSGNATVKRAALDEEEDWPGPAEAPKASEAERFEPGARPPGREARISPAAAKLPQAPWSLQIDHQGSLTVVRAKLHRNQEFEIHCERIEVKAPEGALVAAGKVKVLGPGIDGTCQKLTVPFSSDRLVLEGGAEACVREAQPSKAAWRIRGESLSLDLGADPPRVAAQGLAAPTPAAPAPAASAPTASAPEAAPRASEPAPLAAVSPSAPPAVAPLQLQAPGQEQPPGSLGVAIPQPAQPGVFEAPSPAGAAVAPPPRPPDDDAVMLERLMKAKEQLQAQRLPRSEEAGRPIPWESTLRNSKAPAPFAPEAPRK